MLTQWAQYNNRVVFISENLPRKQLPIFRTEKIARARNIVLSLARDNSYESSDVLFADADKEFKKLLDEVSKV